LQKYNSVSSAAAQDGVGVIALGPGRCRVSVATNDGEADFVCLRRV
jgi:hypothetical protein